MTINSMSGLRIRFRSILIPICIVLCLVSCKGPSGSEGMKTGEYLFPDGYLDQPDTIPSFWVATNSEINLFLKTKVSKGKVERIGTSAGGRPVMAVMYGEPRKGNGTTTFSGACGINNIAPY